MERDIKLSAQGLTRDYAGRRAVDRIDLTLVAGEILGLLGPNGAGKTTILRMLAGTLAPTGGSVHLAGTDMARTPRRAKRHLGYLPERPPLYPELSVDAYLGFCARLHRVPRSRSRAALAAAKRDCGLEDTGKRLIGHLSKGFQQRVGIAQAIVHRPEVLILDEPSAGLDPNQLRDIRALIARLARDHSVIVSSHILSEIQASASRVMILHEGRCVLDAPIDTATARCQHIEIELAERLDADALAALPGVADVHPIGARRWRLATTPGADNRAAIAERIVARGWRLLELRRHAPSLEERFAELTSRPAAATEPAP